MNKCQSCGMSMDKPEDYGGGRIGSSYCRYCTDDQGNLLSQETVREKMIQFQMKSLNKSQEQAERDVDRHIALMPAWQRGGGQMPDEPKTPGSEPTGGDQPTITPSQSQPGPSVPSQSPVSAPGESSPVSEPIGGSVGAPSDGSAGPSPAEPAEQSSSPAEGTLPTAGGVGGEPGEVPEEPAE